MDSALGSAYRATYFAPRSAAAWNTLGTILQSIGHDDSAEAAYRRAVALDSSAVYARNNLCYLAFLHGDGPQALAECSAALTSDPRFVPARNNLALTYAATGNEDRAQDEFSAAGGEAAGHFNAGIVLLAERRYSAAILAFEAAYHLDPGFDEAHARARDARRLAHVHRDEVHVDR
jgi:Tfp pilus assembly protein PilF